MSTEFPETIICTQTVHYDVAYILDIIMSDREVDVDPDPTIEDVMEVVNDLLYADFIPYVREGNTASTTFTVTDEKGNDLSTIIA